MTLKTRAGQEETNNNYDLMQVQNGLYLRTRGKAKYFCRVCEAS